MYILTFHRLLAAVLILLPLLSTAQRVSTSGSCGNGVTCKGSSFGSCCSASGFCGSGSSYCGGGCQSSWGSCSSGMSNVSPSDDGSCGANSEHQYTCQGSALGNCCSASGFCGRSDTYCGDGCQSGFGTCGGGGGGSGSSSPPPQNSPQPVPVVSNKASAPPASKAPPKSSPSPSHASNTPVAAASTSTQAAASTSIMTVKTVSVSALAANTSAAASSTQSSVASDTSVPSAAQATAPPPAPQSAGLSVGAKAGIAVGCAVALLLLAGLIALALLRKRRSKKAWADQPPPLPPKTMPMEKDAQPSAAELPMWMGVEKDGQAFHPELPTPVNEKGFMSRYRKGSPAEMEGVWANRVSRGSGPAELPAYSRPDDNLTRRMMGR